MKKENIFNLIIEGPDGVGKSTLINNLFKHYNFRYMCYHRGEMSNLVFARKYNRQFYATQNRLPFIYIYLTCSEVELATRIINRSKDERWSDEDFAHEISKLSDISLFEQAYKDMKTDYTIFRIDTTNCSATDTLNKVIKILDEYQDSLEDDNKITSWNEMYKRTCSKYGIKFKVVDNQPYIDGRPCMVESTLHNGEFETYSSKRCYDNTIYAMGYDDILRKHKTIDFHYIINSKIKRRPEIFEYYKAFEDAHLTCMVSGRNDLVKSSEYLVKQADYVAEQYLENISKCHATVYCSRDLAYLKLQTARLYEAILAKNIVFVDILTDPDNEILRQIYKDDYSTIKLLAVSPVTIAENYKTIMKDKELVKHILEKQEDFWRKNVKACIDFYKGESK